MSERTESLAAPRPLLDAGLLAGDASFRRLLEAVHGLEAGGVVSSGGLWGSSQAYVFAALHASAQGPWLLVLANEAEAEAFAEDLGGLGVPCEVLPARESYSRGGAHADPDTVRRRLQVTQRLAGPPERRPRVVLASLLSLLQPVPSPRDLEREFLHLQTGQHLELEGLLERLVGAGYVRQPLAEQPGEVSLRGDILDVFPYAADLPVRVELFDDEIESLRTFDPETQRSVGSSDRVSLCLASDAGGVEDGTGLLAVQLLSAATVWCEIEPLRVEEQAEGLRIQSSAHARALLELRRHLKTLRRVELQSLPGKTVDLRTRSVQALSVGIKDAPRALSAEVEKGSRVVVLCKNEGEEHRFSELLSREAPGLELDLRAGSLARGFRMPDLGLVVVNHRELLGVVGARTHAPQRRHQHRVRALDSFFELKEGDLVVHAVHGVARFVGLELLERAGAEEEHLNLAFANDVTVYVPASRIDLVQRYVGSGAHAPELDRVGGQAFRRRQEKVEKALIDLAAELLEVQARRELVKRPPWRPADDLVRSLVEAFPHVDTPDQAKEDVQIAADLARERPMDRLLCGDVGFGKTELAVRAAFRVVASGGQVAMLAPTTVLAHQHYETFRERLADFPVEVGTISRYVTGRKARETLVATARGELDVLIGTHRILSKDVTFRNLGLVIIDEEQRFGVAHKEHFKGLRAEIDVLTLTATPIPRTLHMSLSGLRDISALTVAPEGRQEIETLFVWSQDRARVREALLREKNRGGQAFFLHNRVQSIERIARELMALVPECTYAVGHGQMTGRELEQVMNTFANGDVDVLVATTIVENGIDIPTANTILIDEADHFGLAELHQLRGRVGRGSHKAYCYLLIDRTKPMREVARQRLQALEELTQLGAGFQISMKDLEIRGAGNILGAQQSGHIAAIGYDMYCRLLKQTVERVQEAGGVEAARDGFAELIRAIPAEVTREIEAAAVELEMGVPSHLPAEWIPSADARIELLRKLDAIQGDEEAREFQEMLRDRYGRVPPAAASLVRQFVLRHLLRGFSITRLLYRGETYLVDYADRVLLEGVLAGHGVEVRPLRAGRAHVVIPPGQREPAAAWAWIEGLLREARGEVHG